jgi:hypothetical protein
VQYTLGVLRVYGFLEAVTLNSPADAKKKISVQKLLSDLGR